MDYNSPEFRKWLDKLQRESWQLELIISGFAIYGLFAAYDTVVINQIKASVSDHSTLSLIWYVVKIICSILIFNLVLHVLLRGLWIGAVGLRYVSGDINYQKLNYSEKFTNYLLKTVGSFDRYIARLENYCSILFSVTFLLIFYVLGFFLTIFVFAGIGFLIEQLTFIQEDVLDSISTVIGYILLVPVFIVLIDFLGQGFLKKKNWTSKIYFPIYWIFSKLTLSFLYRPLAYNFLDNKFGRRISFWLVPIYILIISISNVYYKDSSYLISPGKSSEEYLCQCHYEDESIEDTAFINTASIPSKVIRQPYLKIFMTYNVGMEDIVIAKNDSLKDENDKRGLTHFFIENVGITIQGEKVKEAVKGNNLKAYLKTMNNLYKLKIDSLSYRGDFIVSKNKKDQLGFEDYLNINTLSEGKHVFTITGPFKENKFDKDAETVEKVLATIPFWYYKE